MARDDMPRFPIVTTPSEKARLGYDAFLGKASKKQLSRWGQMGGRPPNRTLEEIRAGIYPKRADRQAATGAGKPRRERSKEVLIF